MCGMNVIKLTVSKCNEEDPTNFFYEVEEKKAGENFSSDLQKVLEIESIELKNQDIEIIKLRKKNKELKKSMAEVKKVSEDYSITAAERVKQLRKIFSP